MMVFLYCHLAMTSFWLLCEHWVINEMSVSVLSEVLGLDAYTVNFGKLATRITKLSRSARIRLLRLCDQGFRDSVARQREATRVALAKTLIALLPDSFEVIKYWLSKRNELSVFEIHFSLFCYLDEVQ